MSVDVATKRGAVCNTDHHLACAMIKLQRMRCGRPAGRRKKFEVEKLISSKGEDSVICGESVGRAREGWNEDGEVEEKWSEEQIDHSPTGSEGSETPSQM